MAENRRADVLVNNRSEGNVPLTVQALTVLIKSEGEEGQLEEADASIHDLVLRKWEHEWEARLKAHVEHVADEGGCTWWDIVMENRELFLGAPEEHWNPDA